MKAASVCSGIGAPECAWRDLDIEFAFCSEIEPFPSAVLKHHYPEVENLGDFTRIGDGWTIDLLAGGTPCQDFSVAGFRAGMDGRRGQLTVEFALLAGRLRPRWLVWENVPGILSIDEGRAFGIFLALLGELGYGFAYRILDAQYFGVAQRRRRVFVVGHLGDWRRAAAVLFERESLSGHPPPRRETGERTSYELAPCIGASGRGFERTSESRGQDCVVATLGASYGRLQGCSHNDANRGHSHLVAYGGNNYSGAIEVATACQAHPGRQSFESETFVAHSLRADGFDASEDGTGRGTPIAAVALQSNQSGIREVEAHATLDSNNGSRRHNGVVQSIAVRRLTPRECERLQGFPDDYTLIEYNGKLAADGPRYKALGNAMAVPVMRWIGERILTVECLP